jgi:hypothetical protein
MLILRNRYFLGVQGFKKQIFMPSYGNLPKAMEVLKKTMIGLKAPNKSY